MSKLEYIKKRLEENPLLFQLMKKCEDMKSDDIIKVLNAIEYLKTHSEEENEEYKKKFILNNM